MTNCSSLGFGTDWHKTTELLVLLLRRRGVEPPKNQVISQNLNKDNSNNTVLFTEYGRAVAIETSTILEQVLRSEENILIETVKVHECCEFMSAVSL